MSSLGFELDPVFKDRERFRVMIVASIGPSTFLDLQSDTEMNQGELAEHVERLKESAYVEVEQLYRLFRKPRTIVRGTEKATRTFKDWLRFLENKLQQPSPPANPQ